VGAKQVGVLIFVTRSYEPFQTQPFKVHSEIVKEIAYARVVAVTKHRFPAEVVSIMPQFILYIRQLRIKLVVLCLPCGVQICIFYCHTLGVRGTGKYGCSSYTFYLE
jgi:hypothetical protein